MLCLLYSGYIIIHVTKGQKAGRGNGTRNAECQRSGKRARLWGKARGDSTGMTRAMSRRRARSKSYRCQQLGRCEYQGECRGQGQGHDQRQRRGEGISLWKCIHRRQGQCQGQGQAKGEAPAKAKGKAKTDGNVKANYLSTIFKALQFVLEADRAEMVKKHSVLNEFGLG